MPRPRGLVDFAMISDCFDLPGIWCQSGERGENYGTSSYHTFANINASNAAIEGPYEFGTSAFIPQVLDSVETAI